MAVVSIKKILLIEDDRRIAQNIRRSLAVENYQVEIAYEGYVGMAMALRNTFDLLLLDVNLPDLSGFEVCRRLRSEKSHLPIIMLTALGEVEDKIEGLGLGADDYLVKPFDIRELMARVASCLRRTELKDDSSAVKTLQIADLVVDLSSKIVTRRAIAIELTAKEYALLTYLLKNQGRIISKMDLNRHVWNLSFDPGTNIVEVYINYLRKKIDRDFEPKLIHTKTGQGYILREEPI